MITIDQVNKFYGNPNVMAFMKIIRNGEGTNNSNGYRTLFGGGLFDSLKVHPNILVRRGKYSSTAAGAYQILYKTWIMIQKALNLPDFGEESQDKAAIYLLIMRGVIDYVVKGDIKNAIDGINKTTGADKEWASLPDSPYGQPTRTMEQEIRYFKEAGGSILA